MGVEAEHPNLTTVSRPPHQTNAQEITWTASNFYVLTSDVLPNRGTIKNKNGVVNHKQVWVGFKRGNEDQTTRRDDMRGYERRVERGERREERGEKGERREAQGAPQRSPENKPGSVERGLSEDSGGLSRTPSPSAQQRRPNCTCPSPDKVTHPIRN